MSEELRVWPGDQELADQDLVQATCSNCDQVWGIHDDMSGYRLQCECGHWIDVPWSERAIEQAVPQPVEPARISPREDPSGRRSEGEDGLVRLEPQPVGEMRIDPIPTSVPLGPGELRHASVATRARWTNRAILELTAILLAFWIPALAVSLVYDPSEWMRMMPFAGLVSSVVVVMVAATAGGYSFGGLRAADRSDWAEAIGMAALAVVGAYYYSELIQALAPELAAETGSYRKALGLPLALFVIAVLPGIFEELAFRGLLQGRLSALFGTNLGILLTAVAFALAHGVTLALPIHFLLGLYLCWARVQWGSLLPCMLFHMLYNGAIVWLLD